MPKKDKKIKKIKQKQSQMQSIVINIGKDKIKRRRQYKRKAKQSSHSASLRENEYISPAVIPPIIQNMLLPTIPQPQALAERPFQIEKPASILEQPTMKEQMSSQKDNFKITPEYYTRDALKMIPEVENPKIVFPERQELPESITKPIDYRSRMTDALNTLNTINENMNPKKLNKKKKKIIIEPGEDIFDSERGVWRDINDINNKPLIPLKPTEILENINMKKQDVDAYLPSIVEKESDDEIVRVRKRVQKIREQQTKVSNTKALIKPVISDGNVLTFKEAVNKAQDILESQNNQSTALYSEFENQKIVSDKPFETKPNEISFKQPKLSQRSINSFFQPRVI